jgi:hypothetical protein
VKDKIWDVIYQNHLIKAINKVSLFPPSTSEILEINNVIIKHARGNLLRSFSTISSKYSFNGVDRAVEVRFAQKTNSLGKIGCQIFVDRQQIGGDKSIEYPDEKQVAKMSQKIEKGFFLYFTSTGLLNYGLPFALVMTLIDLQTPIVTRIGKFMFHLLFYGLFMSCFSWIQMKNMVKELTKYSFNSNPVMS